MIYLSRLILNPRSRQVRAEITDPYEMHRTVMRAFIGQLPEKTSGPTPRVLFRLDLHPRTGVPTLMVQSPWQPDWSFLIQPERGYLLDSDVLPLEVDNPAVKPIELHLRQGQVLSFRLLANPSVKKDRRENNQGHRIGLIHEDDQLKWLERKIQAAGGTLLSARAAPGQMITGKLFRDGRKHNISILAVLFDGLLRVENPRLLEQSVYSGIGSAKGLGFGLLSLAPAQ